MQVLRASRDSQAELASVFQESSATHLDRRLYSAHALPAVLPFTAHFAHKYAPESKTRTAGSYASTEEHVCSRCKQTFNARGWPTHRAKCEREAEMEANDAVYVAQLTNGVLDDVN